MDWVGKSVLQNIKYGQDTQGNHAICPCGVRSPTLIFCERPWIYLHTYLENFNTLLYLSANSRGSCDVASYVYRYGQPPFFPFLSFSGYFSFISPSSAYNSHIENGFRMPFHGHGVSHAQLL